MEAQKKHGERAMDINDLIAASAPNIKQVELTENFVVTVRELSGKERFAAAQMADDDRWSVMRWLAFTGMVDPLPDNIDQMDALRPEWVVSMAKAVMGISGMTLESADEMENESANVTDIGTS